MRTKGLINIRVSNVPAAALRYLRRVVGRGRGRGRGVANIQMLFIFIQSSSLQFL